LCARGLPPRTPRTWTAVYGPWSYVRFLQGQLSLLNDIRLLPDPLMHAGCGWCGEEGNTPLTDLLTISSISNWALVLSFEYGEPFQARQL